VRAPPRRPHSGRYGETAEAGDLIAFLCSARAAYITGTAINLDGGTANVV
jgi:3-oxoacyl-[acyl-carrier protein] reductase